MRLRAGSAAMTVAVFLTGCGGSTGPATTADPVAEAAEEYALSALRAIEGTRFESLDGQDVAALVIEVCGALAASSDPDAAVAAFLDDVDVPAGPEVDDQIMGRVLAEGASAVCPDVVDEARLRAWEAAAPEERYLSAILAVAPQLDIELTAEALVAAGWVVCSVLDEGGSPEAAVVAEFTELFGVTAVSVDEIAAGEAGEREGLLAGGVLGAAASFLCPQHRDAVMAYLEALAEENAE